MKKEIKLTIEQNCYHTFNLFKKTQGIKSNSQAFQKIIYS